MRTGRLLIACVLIATACVSRGRLRLEADRNASLTQQLQRLEEENARLRVDITDADRHMREAQNESRACEAKLAEIDRAQKAELLKEIAGLRERLPDVEEKGYLAGQLRLWESLRIVGRPREERRFLSTNRYYRIELSLAGTVFFSHEIQTERREGAVARAFAALLPIAEIAMRLPLRGS